MKIVSTLQENVKFWSDKASNLKKTSKIMENRE